MSTVLRSSDGNYITNGNFTVSPSGLFDAAGTLFDYRRLDSLVVNASGRFDQEIEGVTEWITSTGPTIEAIQLLVSLIIEMKIIR